MYNKVKHHYLLITQVVQVVLVFLYLINIQVGGWARQVASALLPGHLLLGRARKHLVHLVELWGGRGGCEYLLQLTMLPSHSTTKPHYNRLR